MAQNGIYDFVVNISANSAELAKGIKEANSKINGFQSFITKQMGDISNIFTKVIPAIAGVAGSLGFLKKSIESIDGPGDAMAEVMAGVSGSMFEVQRSVATLDFTNFFSNIISGYEKAKELEAALDELAERTAYTDYKISQLQGEKAGLRETIKNKSLELSERIDAAQKTLKIEESIKARRESIATSTYNIEKQGWENRNKLSFEQAVKYNEIVTNADEKEKKALDDKWDYIYNQLGLRGNAAIEKLKEISKNTGVNSLKAFGVSDEVINAYTQLKVLTIGESDALVKMYKIASTYHAALTMAQSDYNREVGITTGLLEKNEKAIDRYLSKLKGPGNISTQSTVDCVTQSTNNSDKIANNWSPSVLPDRRESPVEEGKKSVEETKTQLQEVTIIGQTLKDTFKSVGEAIADAFTTPQESFKGFLKTFGQMIITIIKQLLKLILTALVTVAILSLIPGLAPLMGFGSKDIFKNLSFLDRMKTVMPKMANGGLAYGNSIVNVGEYSGARSNPEVIAPLSKLQTILSANSINGKEVKFRIDGYDLVGVLEKQRKIMSA